MITLFGGLLAKRLRCSVMRDINATVRLQHGMREDRAGRSLRIDIPEVKSSGVQAHGRQTSVGQLDGCRLD